MALPEQRVLRHDLLKAQHDLNHAESQFGKQSQEYQTALKQFARLWNVLRLTHSQDAFLKDLMRQPQ